MRCYRDLRHYEKHDPEVAAAVLTRMNNHLWYISEEFAVVSLASELIDDKQKRKIANAILQQPKGQHTRGAVSTKSCVT